MSRHKGYAMEDAQAAFRKELEHRMLDLGISSKQELAIRLGKAPRTVYRKFENVRSIDIDDLAALKVVLYPNPLALLKACGYSDREIFRAFAEAQAKQNAV